MTNTRPDSVLGSKPNPSAWLTITEAVRFHFEHTPRQRQIHRSAPYRWASDNDHPVNGEWFAGQLYIERASLDAFCRDGRRRRSRPGRHQATPADAAQAADAIERMRTKHAITTDAKGGVAA